MDISIDLLAIPWARARRRVPTRERGMRTMIIIIVISGSGGGGGGSSSGSPNLRPTSARASG